MGLLGETIMSDTLAMPPKAESEFPKEILVAVPLFGSAIAISYESRHQVIYDFFYRGTYCVRS
jgi:hypothetical protein